jgi:DNA-binding response OmpR family regulator
MRKEKIKILFAEDDLNLGLLLVDMLGSEGFEVELCRDGKVALKSFERNKYDVCLLDIMMPELDGFSLAKAIRANDKRTPIVFISAKSLKKDKLKGYELGADDYIVKPFDDEELLWKIKAIIRRAQSEVEVNTEALISIGKYIFDFQNQSLAINGEVRRVTKKECEVLYYLIRHPNKLVKREELLKELWGGNDYFLGRSMDVFISKIRKYLKDDSHISIENVFGVGFILNVPVE